MDDVINTREASQAEWDAYERAHENEDAAFDEVLTTGAPETTAGTARILPISSAWMTDVCPKR